MDHVFGVVHEEDVETPSAALFFDDNPLVNPVETIGFGRGAVVGNDDLVHVARAARDGVDAVLRLGIVGIGAAENVVIGRVVVDRRQVVIEHLLDDVGFFPGRNQDRDALFFDAG